MPRKAPSLASTPTDLAEDLTIAAPQRAAAASPRRGASPQRPSLNPRDESKIAWVRSTSIPASAYTPSVHPPFMEDYYSGDIERPQDTASLGAPSKAVIAEGESTQLVD